MANNYTQTSVLLEIPVDKLKVAVAVCDDAELELIDLDEYCGINWAEEDNGIWFYHDESANIDHLHFMACAVIEACGIDKPFYCSWAYTCDKPRIDEFGGGAFAIIRGRETVWIDALTEVGKIVSENGLV